MHNDVPSPIDLRLMPDALEWAQTAMSKRPWRKEFFARFADEMGLIAPERILELGSGPGFLAEYLLNYLPEVSYTLLDFSPAMHQLAAARLSAFAAQTQFIERSFKAPDWTDGLGKFAFIVTNQAVHELRHKHYASQLHAQVKTLLAPGGAYLVCDHYAGEDGMCDDQLYMSIAEQEAALLDAGFSEVRPLLLKGGMALYRAG